MQIHNLVIKYYKKLRNVEVQFPAEGNIYIVFGDNEIGKTSLIEVIRTHLLALSTTKDPVTFGEDKCESSMLFTTKDGDQYKSSFTIPKGGKAKFELLNIQTGDKKKTVGDIRNVFKFTDMSSEEFMQLSYTEKGRREQREIILNTLPEEVKTLFDKYCKEEKEKFSQRTEKNKVVDTLQIQLDAISIKESEYKVLVNDQKRALDKLIDLELKLSEYKSVNLFKLRSLADNIKNVTEALKDQQTKYMLSEIPNFNVDKFCIELLSTERIINDLKTKKDGEGLAEKIKQTEELIQKGKDYINSIVTAKESLASIEDKKKQLQFAKDEVLKLTADIESLREAKTKLIVSIGSEIPEIAIEEDGIYYKMEDGNQCALTNESVCTSKAIMITCKILMMVNKTTKVLLVGRVESLGTKNLNKIVEMAEENGYIMFGDEVVRDGEFMISGIEEGGIIDTV